MKRKSKQDIEHLIEQKIVEFFGDPDSGLALKKDFLAKLQRRLRGQQRLVSNADVLKKYGVS